MKWIGRHFGFEAPESWSHFVDGRRHVWQGSQGEELIVSLTDIAERWPLAGSDNDRKEAIRTELVAGALEAIRNSASHPELRCVEALVSHPLNASEQQWRMASETHDQETVFLQGLHATADGVLLVTMEAPRNSDGSAAFNRLLSSVKTSDAPGDG